MTITERENQALRARVNELREGYNALRAAINKHMSAHGYPNLKGSEADRALWSVLDRA